MFKHLQIPYREERWLVGLADTGLQAVRLAGWPRRAQQQVHQPPRRILLLRLERIGDLLMVLDAISRVRTLAPAAEIDLVVGSWNLPLARLIPGINSVETLDVPWMTRQGRGLSWTSVLARARAWRRKGYDLALNFEPDIRSNLLLALSGAPRRAGFISGGGGALLTDALSPDPRAHIADNANALVDGVFGPRRDATRRGRLNIPDEARRRAVELVGTPKHGVPLVGIQPAAGRQIKEWEPARFAQVGSYLARTHGAAVVLMGAESDRAVLDAVRRAWPADVPLIELPVQTDLVVLAAVLERLALLITGDTGPMHLAAAMGTPIVAIFGPSLPTRYAPLSERSKVVRIDIACSPCNLMRRPPERCVGHVPDCLAGITTESVLQAAEELLDASDAPNAANAPR